MNRSKDDNSYPTAFELLDTAPPSLAGWYADPLDATDTADLLLQVEASQQTCLRRGASCFRVQLLALICHEWLLGESHNCQEPLAGNDYERALQELVRGQLLASRKLKGALDYLEHGFHLAAPRLAPQEYFELLHRHESLACLSFTDTPSAPQDLAALLNEAAVTKRLRGNECITHPFDHGDTVG